MLDDPPLPPAGAPSQREIELEEQLAEARARAADLERMIDTLRQQVAQLRAELAARQAATGSAAQAPAAPASPRTAPAVQSRPLPDQSASAPTAPVQRSWDEDPADGRPAWTPPPAVAAPPMPLPTNATTDAGTFLSSMRAAYAMRFPSIPSAGQREAFDAFTGDVVKWSAAQQRSLRVPVTWTVQLVRVEKGSSKDRTVRFIARASDRGGSAGMGEQFVVRVPRTDSAQLLASDYRGTPYSVTGTLAPIVRFAPERPYDGISSNHSAFVGPYCEMSIVLDAESISPGS